MDKQQLVVRREQMALKARYVDELAMEARAALAGAETFEKALAVAQCMNDLRVALTEDMMQPVMALMNTQLGFKTDRDPARGGDKPYPVEVVRECFIESQLRGLHPVGNEWNIISGQCYAALAGLERKAKTYPGVSNLREDIDVPRLAGDRGAIVKVKCSWKLNGKDDSLEAEIPVRVNSGMGADAIIGKARRKMFARVLQRLTGKVEPDGDADDTPVINADTGRVEQPRFSPLTNNNAGAGVAGKVMAGAADAGDAPKADPAETTAPARETAPPTQRRTRVRQAATGQAAVGQQPTGGDPVAPVNPAPEKRSGAGAAEDTTGAVSGDSGGLAPVGPSEDQIRLNTMLDEVFAEVHGASFDDVRDFAEAHFRSIDFSSVTDILGFNNHVCREMCARRKGLTLWLQANVDARNRLKGGQS